MAGLIHWWCREYPVTDAAEEAKVTHATTLSVPLGHLQLNAPHLMEGGPGVVVQTNHSLHISRMCDTYLTR